MNTAFSALLPFFGILVILLLVVAALKAVTRSRRSKPDFLYEKTEALFTPAERSFLGVLDQAVQGQFRIFAKVRVADIVTVRKGISASVRQSLFNRIQSKHVDFVACDPGDLSVKFVVELDDASHQRQDRKERDAFVDEVMQACGIPIFHFPARRAYSVEDLRKALFAES